MSVDAAGGTAEILLAMSAGAPRSLADGLPPGSERQRATLGGGRLVWTGRDGDRFEARRNDFLGEAVEIAHTPSRTIGREANPQGEIGLSRLQ